MKRLFKGLAVVVICLVLSLGVGLPTGLSDLSGTTITEVHASQSIRKKVKKAIDTYYSFYKSYVRFMKKYNSSGFSLEMLEKYQKLIEKAKKVDKKFNKIKRMNLSNSELSYWIKIHNKVINLLSTI